MKTEYWKEAAGLEGIIEVSSLGRARALPRKVTFTRNGSFQTQSRPGKILSPNIGKAGYKIIAVQMGGKRTKYLLHRLIAQAFVPGYEAHLTVNHINGDKLNNDPGNLEWITRSRNTEHQWETGLVDLRGEKHPGAKLTERKVLILRRLLALGATRNELADLVGVSFEIIEGIAAGRRWNHVGSKAA